MNEVLNAALLYANNGIPVFPCAGKVPATPNGFKDASIDKIQIAHWFGTPGYNIAMRPADAGLVVIDVDIGSDPAIKEQLPATHTVRTPSGGYHYYYRSDEQFGNSKLFPKVDIRSANGYVLVPPSPGYMIVDSQEPTRLPRWVSEKLYRPATEYTPPVEGEVVSRKRLVDILSRIDPGCDEKKWSTVIAACSTLKPEFDLDMQAVLMDWSAGCYSDRRGEPENYCGDDFDMGAKLARFKGTDNPATMGTLLFLAGMLDHDTLPLAPPDYSAESWAVMDIKAPTQLIGPINDSSRVMIHAPTGIGKTFFSMALSASLAAGTSFLHWNVPKAGKVLYIDGEMPQGLMKERVIEMMRHVGPMDRRLTLLSHSLFSTGERLMPLNEPEGQAQIRAWIDRIQPDLIVFDNIQSLTAGDLKENMPWRAVQEWVRPLKAHIWVHHANKDGTAYGDKSREWQFDTVIGLMPVDDADEGELTFDLKFRKQREDNFKTNDYQEGRFILRSNGWSFTTKKDISARELIPLLQREGALKLSEIAKHLDMKLKTVQRRAEGPWAGYVIPKSSPIKLAIPEATEGF